MIVICMGFLKFALTDYKENFVVELALKNNYSGGHFICRN